MLWAFSFMTTKDIKDNVFSLTDLGNTEDRSTPKTFIILLLSNNLVLTGVVAHACDPSIGEAEARGSLQV